MNTSLAIAEGTGLIFLASALLIFIHLVARKLWMKNEERRKQTLMAAFQQADSAVEHYLRTGEQADRLKLRRPYEYEALEAYFGQRIKANAAREKELIYRFADRYFHRYYAQRLNRRRWSNRMGALLYIERFRLHRLLPDVKELLLRRRLSDEERYLVYRVMASLQDKDITRILLSSPDRLLPAYVYRQILLVLEMPHLEQLIAAFDRCPLPLQESIIDILRTRNERTYPLLELLERTLDHEQAELRIRALKALANFGYMSGDGVRRLCESFDLWRARSWQERLMVAKLMGSLKEAQFLPYLQEMIGDPSFHIRAEAAAAISRYKHGTEWLEFIRDHHSDRYARDMAGEILNRGVIR
ncbi:HEAT repeat domain-containing protein [Paenibacillus beijingensis]|uniref:HEAT repeat domain-containing protein n=1 Tax=Paenibacillus beijingensis TaxID=1126833 RepID=A0A0D5NGN8_9BACL|nr:HEAT repeat domain-containing protein [Paenibacillus beijingensis]AJY74107.1 hypothetical protein VN24_05195 [Paenibacillus beijingensis]